MKPAWVEKNGERIFPITHSRALLGGISSKAYNINDSVYGNDWNNITDNGLYYDENGSNRPPVGVNTYPDNLLIEVENIKDKYVTQKISMLNTELFSNAERETVGYIRDRYMRIGTYSSGSVSWSDWKVLSSESDINRVYIEDTSSTESARSITMSDITDVSQLLNKVIYVKSIESGVAGTATLNVNGYGAKPLRTPRDGTFTTNLEDNWIIIDQIYSVSYDGTNFNIVGAGGSGGGSGFVKSSDNSNLDWVTMTKEEFEQARQSGLLVDGTVYNVLDGGVAASSANPVGSVLLWFGLLTKIPSNYVLCDGRLLNIADYPVYADRYGTTYGGDGATTVGVPNIKGRVVVQLDSSQTEFNSIGKTGGSKSVTLTTDQIPAHSHKTSGSSSGNTGTKTMVLTNTGFTGDQATISDTSNTGGGQAHTNLQPYIVGYYIIKVKPEAYTEDLINLDSRTSMLKSNGDGTKYLADDGTYKTVSGGGTSGDYLPLTGGTMSGTISSSKTTFNYLAGSQGTAVINSTASGGAYTTLLKANSSNGKFTLSTYQTYMLLGYMSNDTIEAGTNKLDKSWIFLEDGTLTPGASNVQNLGSSSTKWLNVYATTFTGNLSGNASSATKLQTARTINGVAFDGSSNITINIPQEFFYYTGEISKEDAERYMKMYFPGTNISIGYVGKPDSSDLVYVTPVYNKNTAYAGSIYLKKYVKDIPEYGDEYDGRAARSGEWGSLSTVESAYTGNNFSVYLNCYSVGLTKIELGYYRSTIDSATYTNKTPSSIDGSDNEYFSLSMSITASATNIYYIVARLTYSDGEVVTISRDSLGKIVSIQITAGGLACFTGNTKVYTSEGLRDIADIDIGDKVLSYNAEEKIIELKPVDKVVSHTADKIYRIDIDAEVIESSWSHPFYTENRGRILAKDLKVGDVLRCYDDRLIEIKSIEIVDEPTDVYEIRVKDNNNYFVGSNSVLVYNEDSVLDN